MLVLQKIATILAGLFVAFIAWAFTAAVIDVLRNSNSPEQISREDITTQAAEEERTQNSDLYDRSFDIGFMETCATEGTTRAECQCMLDTFSDRYPDFRTNIERLDRYEREEFTDEELRMVMRCVL